MFPQIFADSSPLRFIYLFCVNHRNLRAKIDIIEETRMEKQKPVFEKRIFWDVNFENLDYDAKANFVIERVFDRGDVQDIRNCRRYYGDEKVTQSLLNAKFLSETSVSLASAVINKPLTDFRCYKLRQLNPTLLPY